jgi:DNA polymerase IV
MILFVRRRPFYTTNARGPTVVVRDKHVLECDPIAARNGVVRGMGASEAKSVLHAALPGQAAFVRWKAEDFEDARRAWLDSCVELTDVIEPVDQHEAFLDLSSHPRPDELLERLEGFQIGVARCKWLARVACERGDAQRFAYFVPNAFLDTLSTSLLEPVTHESRKRLEFLGYHTAGQVSRLPLETLKAQFGQEALTIWQASRGSAGTAVRALYPDATVSDRVYFESPVETRQGVEETILTLSERLGNRLQSADLQGNFLRLWLTDEDGREFFSEREFAKPMQSAFSIRFAALLMACLDRPLTGIRLQMPHLRKANRKQQELYVARSDDHAVKSVVRQVKSLYGEDALRLGAEIPLSRRQRLRRVWKEATGWN